MLWGADAGATAFPENFRLVDSEGLARTLLESGNDSPVLVMAVDPTCPASRGLVAWVSDVVGHRFAAGTRLLFLDPDSKLGRDGAGAIRASEAPILMDDAQSVSRSLGFRSVGDFLLLDPAADSVVAKGNAFDGALERAVPPEPVWRKWLRFATPAPPSGAACALAYRPLPVSLTPEIAGAITRSCLYCHQQGAPLDIYRNQADFHSWHAMNNQVLRMFRMPIGGVDFTTPACKVLAGPDLEPGDLRLIQSWIDAGEPPATRGDPIVEARAELARPRLVKRKFRADFHAAMATPEKIEASTRPHYSYVILSDRLPRDMLVKALRLSYNNHVVHHVTFFETAYPQQPQGLGIFNQVLTEDLAATKLVGLVLWGAGEGSGEGSFRSFPPGTHLHLHKGYYLGLVIHYEPNGRTEMNRASLDLELVDPLVPGKPIHTVTLERQPFRLKPGQKDFVVTKIWRADHDVSILDLSVHGHMRLVASRVEIKYPGRDYQTFCNAPYRTSDWAIIQWQKQPHRLPAGSEIRVTMRYDNSVANAANPDSKAPVGNGIFTETDEMDLVRFRYVDGFLADALD